MAKILIVDDSASSRAIVSILLRHQNHGILEASDGFSGLEVVRAEHPDLVILDIDMPGMDGAGFMRELRADTEIAATPVIFYTGYYDQPSTQSLATSCGVRTILSKPSAVETILATVKSELGR